MSTEFRNRLSINQAAEVMGITPCTVRRMIARGDLPAHRMGRKLIRIYADDIANLGKPIGGAV